jgi:hypothetical protein
MPQKNKTLPSPAISARLVGLICRNVAKAYRGTVALDFLRLANNPKDYQISKPVDFRLGHSPAAH